MGTTASSPLGKPAVKGIGQGKGQVLREANHAEVHGQAAGCGRDYPGRNSSYQRHWQVLIPAVRGSMKGFYSPNGTPKASSAVFGGRCCTPITVGCLPIAFDTKCDSIHVQQPHLRSHFASLGIDADRRQKLLLSGIDQVWSHTDSRSILDVLYLFYALRDDLIVQGFPGIFLFQTE